MKYAGVGKAFLLCALLLPPPDTRRDSSPRPPHGSRQTHIAPVRGNEAFQKTFTLVKEYALEKKEGTIDQLIVDKRGFLWVRDWEGRRIEKYDRNGKLVKTIGGIGRAPGRFLFLADFAVDEDKGHVFAVDFQQSRITLFAEDGQLLDSWIIARPGYMPQAFALDRARGFYYVGGSLPLKRFVREGSLHVHAYKLGTNEYVGSFVETDRSVREKNLFNYLVVSSLDVDHAGNVYATLAPVYKVFKIDPKRRTTRAFSGRHRFYRPPPVYRSDVKPEELKRLRETWTQTDRVLVVRGRFVVLSLETHEPFPYGLEIFDVTGRLLRTNMLTNGRLVGKDREGNLYFVADDRRYVIAQYSIAL